MGIKYLLQYFSFMLYDINYIYGWLFFSRYLFSKKPFSIFKIISIAGIVVIGLLFGFILYFILSYRHKQKDYQLLQSQKEQIDN